MIRKITSKEDEEKKSRRNQIIAGLVLVSVMLLSVLGYSFASNPSTNTLTMEYNGYQFTNNGGYWNLNIRGTNFGFVSNPSIAYKFNSSLKPLADYQGKTLYLYSENPNAESEIYQNMQSIASDIQSACPANESKCDKNIQIKTCSDNFIIIREKNETNVLQENGCVFVEGPAADLVRISDGVLLKILGMQ